MSLSKKLRFEIFKRDSFTCQYCGNAAPNVTLQVDHIHPVSQGGTDDILNLITSCEDCNQGKKDRLLSDSTVLQKRKRQLDELQKRREQLEMLMEWQQGLTDIDGDTVNALCELWSTLVAGYALSESGISELRKWMKRFDLISIADAMRTSTSQYLETDKGDARPTQSSVEKAFSYIPRIIGNKQRIADKPHLKDLYYIRGILKNRLSYINLPKTLEYLEQAYESGATIETLSELAKTVRNWTLFVTGIKDLINKGSENG